MRQPDGRQREEVVYNGSEGSYGVGPGTNGGGGMSQERYERELREMFEQGFAAALQQQQQARFNARESTQGRER